MTINSATYGLGGVLLAPVLSKVQRFKSSTLHFQRP
jgi:hypothetical protein